MEKKSFLENPWASHATAYLVPIKQLAKSEQRWSEVFRLATQMIDPDLVDDLLNDNATEHDPRAFITISDDE